MPNLTDDVWAHPEEIDAEKSVELTTHLEQRAQYIDQIEVNTALLNCLTVQPGERWCEVGCGSGVLCRQLAPDLLPDGTLLGIDLSAEMIERAREYASRWENLNNLNFQVEDAAALSFLDETFDGVFATRLFLHAPDPGSILKEMVRVVRPGGKLIAMEWDFESVIVDHSDRALTRRILHWRTDFKDGNNWIGRQLWRQALEANWGYLMVHPVVSIAHEDNTSLVQSIKKAAMGARDAEVISPEECSSWLEEVNDRLNQGIFFASIVYFIIQGKRI